MEDMEMNQQENPQKSKELYEWVQALVCSVLAVVIVFTFGLRMIGVDGHSMLPTLQHGDRLLVLNGAHLAMDGTPDEVFTRAQELLDMGLDIPELTRVFLHLKKLGADVKPVYTLQQAVQQLQQLKGGAPNA